MEPKKKNQWNGNSTLNLAKLTHKILCPINFNPSSIIPFQLKEGNIIL